MNPKSNKDLTNMVNDASHVAYIGAVKLTSQPTGATGKSGDYYHNPTSGANGAPEYVTEYGQSFYFKVGTQWIRMSTWNGDGTTDASTLNIAVDACAGSGDIYKFNPDSNILTNLELTDILCDASNLAYVGAVRRMSVPNSNVGKSGDYYFSETGATQGSDIFYFKVGDLWITIDASGVATDSSLGSADDLDTEVYNPTPNNGRTNNRLTDFVDPSKADYVGAVQLKSDPTGATGKCGDYYYNDPSFYFKVGVQWVVFDGSIVGVQDLG